MVEHVFAGVEREQMKIVPKSLRRFECQKVCIRFCRLQKGRNTNEQAQAEFQLLQETENWYSTLTHRDKTDFDKSSASLLRNRETAFKLTGACFVSAFYRNSPYSEQVRGKFDFVVTRCFPKDMQTNVGKWLSIQRN
jgi:hypothetical protein